MAVIDCSTFQNCEVDALYSEGAERELDNEALAALTEHAKTCPACAARLERLRDNRCLVLSVAVEPVPSDFESRIMAAVDEALAKRGAVVALAPAAAEAKKASGGATILRFMARPSFAVAATFVLVLGGAALMMTRNSAPMRALASSSDESAPAAVAASAATLTPVPVEVAQATAATPPPAAFAMAPAPAMGGHAAAAPVAAAKASKPAASTAESPALVTAKNLASAGRCPEALPKLEALSASTPEADLYAARCIAKTRGCAAAGPRFDKAAQTNAGTEIGSRAQLEGARCYQSTGDVVAARKRFEAARGDETLSAEASAGLDALESSAPAAKAGSPSAGSHASPKAMPAPRAAEPASPATR